MLNFGFGDYIYTLRKNMKLSQTELASKLNVSNKAVSKWETGVALPSVDKLSKLSKIFNVSIESLLSKHDENKTKKIYKIVITGGPCAGKSTAMTWIQKHFEKKGYSVIFIPECATELIVGGINKNTTENVVDFETAVIKLQLAKENVYCNSANFLKDNKILIVCDRGCLDCKAYLEDYEFQSILKSLNLTESALRDSYDAVFHLVTASKGAEEYYTLSNNKARIETPKQAIENDDKIIRSWNGHHYLRIIDNSTDFNTKMSRLISEISGYLGEPIPFEIERKFLIKMPDINILKKYENCKQIDIIQTYLNSTNNSEVRVRQRGSEGSFTYTLTTKKNVNDIKRIEFEERLTPTEYINHLMNADTTKRQIRKTRYCLVYKNQYFEIDIYPFWQDQAIMEIELNDENQDIIFPDFIEIIKEVTTDENFKNSSLADFNNPYITN